MTNQPKEFTLRGYVDIIRRQWWVVLVVGVICAAAGLAYAKLQTKSYSATATLTVNDPNQALGALFGGGAFSGKTPLQESTVAAQQVMRHEVVAAVQDKLRSTDLGSVSASVDPNSYALKITASNASPTRAAAIANAFADVDTSITNTEARKQYAQQAADVKKHLPSLPKQTLLAFTTVEAYNRLQSLAQVATPLQIATSAGVPNSPSSPGGLTTTLAGLAFGLLLGIAVATGRDALDRRLRHSADVAKVLDHPVLGLVRTKALGHAGTRAESSNGGGRLDDPDHESFRILRQNIAYLGPAAESRTVLVTSPVAEEGKSTVAACLAVVTAEAGKRTLLVECDLRKPVLANRLRLSERPGLTDYLTGNAQPHEILQPVPGIVPRVNGNGASPASGSNLVCITAGANVHRPAELLASERFRTFLAEVSEVYDTVILDTAPLLPVADTLAIVPDVSTLIVCLRLRQTTRDQARAAQSALDRLPERPVGLVLTDAGQREDYYYGSYGTAAVSV